MLDNRITALYCRYSFDDGIEGEENLSISHQKSLLTKYAENNGYTNLKYYVDDGYSGTSFERPDFQRMLEDVDNGIIGTIIVKDMSRFGRNYILVGQYVEIVLPLKDVRVIGINDNFDSNNSNNQLFQFESILNEMYAADISKKVRSAKRSIGLSGQPVKSRPVYGYKLKEGTKRECGRKLHPYAPSCNNLGIAYNCTEFIHFRLAYSHHIREEDLKNRFKEQIILFKKKYIESPDIIEDKLGINQISKMQDSLKYMNRRVAEIEKFMQKLFESKVNKEITEDNFQTMSCNYKNEISELQDSIAKISVKLKYAKQNHAEIINNLDYIKNNDFSEITEEICNKLIEKVIIGEYTCFQKKYENFQTTEFYIYGIGQLSDFIVVNHKTVAEKLRELIPELLLERKCTAEEANERLGLGSGMLRKVLLRENTSFIKEVVACKKNIIIKALKEGMTLKEIYPLIGGKKSEDASNFMQREFKKGYKKLKSELQQIE